MLWQSYLGTLRDPSDYNIENTKVLGSPVYRAKESKVVLLNRSSVSTDTLRATPLVDGFHWPGGSVGVLVCCGRIFARAHFLKECQIVCPTLSEPKSWVRLAQIP